MAEPLSVSMLVSGLVLGTTFAIGSTIVGKVVEKIDEAVYRYQHPDPEKEQEEKLEKFMDKLHSYDRPKTNIDKDVLPVKESVNPKPINR